MGNRITPKPDQICVVRFGGNEEYAVWDTGYSIYGSGGHFVLADGSQLGLPCDVDEWFGTHWIATETPGIAINGQTGQTA